MHRLKIVLPIVVVLLVAGGFVGYRQFFKDDAPDKVSLDAAVESAQRSTTTTTGDESTSPTTAADGVDGAWTVDTSTGDFDYDSATGTFAGFRVAENLSGIGSTTAVGRTGDVDGTVTIEGTKVTAATFTVDLSTITTNDSRRDSRVQEALKTATYPDAAFELTEPIDLGDAAETGADISITAVGDLTIHGVTKSVKMPIQAKLVDGRIVAVASTSVTFSDYGIDKPTAPIVLSLDDTGTLEMQLLLTRT